jgi:hypothetical protein
VPGARAKRERDNEGMMRFEFTAPLWEWESRDNWYFVSLPADASEEIAQLPLPPRGFGSVPVTASVGRSTWSTSIFPGADGRYVLPIKRAVRDRNGLGTEGDVDVEVELVE